jgi:hypothetical protein
MMRLLKGFNNAQKNTAHLAQAKKLNDLVKHVLTNSVSVVSFATKHLSGKKSAIKFIENNIGLSFGSKKLIRSDNYAGYLVIAHQSLNGFGDIGLAKTRLNYQLFFHNTSA